MSGRKGSLFDQLREKQPRLASALESMGSAKIASTAISPETPKPQTTKAAATQSSKPPIPLGNKPSIKERAPSKSSGGTKELGRGLNVRAVSKAIPAPTPKVPRDRHPLFRAETKFEGGGEKGSCDLILGIDFGTSSTKVAIRDPYVRSAVFTVDWGEFAHANAAYLLPSCLWESEGQLSFDRGGTQKGNLKLDLIQALANGGDQKTAALCVGFLALVFRYARTWLMTNYESAYSDFDLQWSANVGVPAANFDDADLIHAYQHVSEAAWNLSIHGQPITIQSASTAFAASRAKAACDIEIAIVPEVVAAVTGYAKSPLREPGLHIMVDVGAGTLDVCGFIVHENKGDDIYPILQSSVSFLGVQRLQKTRLASVGGQVLKFLDFVNRDPVAAVPDTTENLISSLTIGEALSISEERYIKECAEAIRLVAAFIKTKKDQKSEVWWRRELPIFLCGGGSFVSCYSESLKIFKNWMRLSTKSPGIKIKKLPPDPSAQNPLTDYDRLLLGVAFGLSHPPYTIGKAIPTRQIPDIKPGRPLEDDEFWWRKREFVSKDMC